jgi:hypothetical protein
MNRRAWTLTATIGLSAQRREQVPPGYMSLRWTVNCKSSMSTSVNTKHSERTAVQGVLLVLEAAPAGSTSSNLKESSSMAAADESHDTHIKAARRHNLEERQDTDLSKVFTLVCNVKLDNM